MRDVADALSKEFALQNTSRLKTRNTLVEKLVREKTNLVNMDDVAGVRLDAQACGVASRSAQDEVRDHVVRRFPDCKVKDRRRSPNFGYRAVHVVVRHERRLIEVQIRTERQHQWAEMTEKLGDLVGRGLRYGEATDNTMAGQMHEALLTLADLIESLEEAQTTAAQALALRQELEEVANQVTADARGGVLFNRLWTMPRVRSLQRRVRRRVQPVVEVQRRQAQMEAATDRLLAEVRTGVMEFEKTWDGGA